ncbi:MAG: SulP family inorganic anion transporter [Planctomycetota bacterium]|nr:SulP family inorganic anion transporter [Planctomycetota bacterium]
MESTPIENSKGSWGKEFTASVVVFLVALPLCMGVAIASGMSPEKGILTGIIGGLIVGIFAGSPLQVSGPAASLSVLCWANIQDFGIETFALIVLLAGAIQIVSGLLRLGQWFRATSPAVIYGMLGGIGVLIFASQFHIMVDDSPRESGFQNLISIPEAIYKGVVPTENKSHHLAAYIGLLTIASLILWERFRPKSMQSIPGALVAVVLASVVALVGGLEVQYVTVPETLADALDFPQMSIFDQIRDANIWTAAATLAFVASAATLLTSVAVDQMHTGPRTSYDRELVAQGIGNILCGVVGALPVAGVIVRSSANVKAGSRSRASTILHGVWLVIFVVVLPSLLALIPTASLAAILVYTGYKLVSPERIRALKAYGRNEVGIYFVTLCSIVLIGLFEGILIGFGLSVLGILTVTTSLHIDVDPPCDEGRRDIHLVGKATFLKIPLLAKELDKLDSNKEYHLYFDKLTYIDHACLELLSDWGKQTQSKGGKLIVEWETLRDRNNYSDRLKAFRDDEFDDAKTEKDPVTASA